MLRIQFNLPSEVSAIPDSTMVRKVCVCVCVCEQRELSIHSSLIGVVNGWPLTLEESHKLCHHFSGDIRRVVLHLQLMLSGKPTDPVAVLDDQVEEECVVANPSANCSLSVESYRHMHCPWRVQTARYLAGHFTTPSHLDMTSILHHQMSQVDNVQSPHQQKELLHCPWTARPKASMLDQLPDYTPSPCTCGSTIRHTLCSMLYSEDPAPNHSNQSAAIRYN